MAGTPWLPKACSDRPERQSSGPPSCTRPCQHTALPQTNQSPRTLQSAWAPISIPASHCSVSQPRHTVLSSNLWGSMSPTPSLCEPCSLQSPSAHDDPKSTQTCAQLPITSHVSHNDTFHTRQRFIHGLESQHPQFVHGLMCHLGYVASRPKTPSQWEGSGDQQHGETRAQCPSYTSVDHFSPGQEVMAAEMQTALTTEQSVTKNHASE